MNQVIKTFCFSSLLLLSASSFAQTNKELAFAKAKEGIVLEDEQGKYDEAIKLFEEAQKLDPGSITYPYEIAYAYSEKKEYQHAADILEKLLDHKEVHARVFQLLGNTYDYLHKPEEADKIYEKGLKKFPNSGELYLESGNMKVVRKDYNGALALYEKGIEKDPQFPSNYYWACKMFCSSEEEVWGMIYGEIFMNLERNSKRTVEISKLLFDTYKSEIKFSSDTSYSISFSQNVVMDINKLKGKDFSLPFGSGTYEQLLIMATINEKSIDISSLDRIRSRFVESYFNGNASQKYPNVLFDYQQKIKNSGHLEAYNHWLLMKGDEDGFERWKRVNTTKWDLFVKWFTDNPMQVDMSHRFYRAQY